MLYREYGKTKKFVSAMGFGSTRFKSSDLNDEAGLHRCAELVYLASEQGVNYFDIAYNYSKSQCEKIYKIAFKMLKKPFFVTAKSSSFQDNTSDDVLRRVENSLKNMDVKKIDFLYMWSIMDEAHYKDIMKKGGAYEGALKAKEQGLVDHIVFSNHATPDIALKIIEDDVFEGITISYSLLNFQIMDPVIKAAAAKNMGITIMNPLAGGLIPQNNEFFSRVIQAPNESVSQATLRFIYSHPEITCVFSGISSKQEIHENVAALSDEKFIGTKRIEAVEDQLKQMEGLCTGCGYCKECPKSIPIPEYMQSYNMTYFHKMESMYGRKDEDLLKRIAVLRKLNIDFHKVPENTQNPCIKCKKCETICTQHLPITKRIDELFNWIKKSNASMEQYKQRLAELLYSKEYKKVAFYTAGGYTAFVLECYKKFFGEPKFEIIILDSNESRWGDQIQGYTIYNPQEITSIMPECIIISNYIYDREIYESLKQYEEKGIKILKLHEANDVPWVF